MAAATLVNLEPGFGDAGLTGGTGQWSLYSLMLSIDSVHSVGSRVFIEDYCLTGRHLQIRQSKVTAIKAEYRARRHRCSGPFVFPSPEIP
jgi:hypothetical protein